MGPGVRWRAHSILDLMQVTEDREIKDIKQINIIGSMLSLGRRLGVIVATDETVSREQEHTVDEEEEDGFEIEDAEAALRAHLDQKSVHKRRDTKESQKQKHRSELAEKPAPQRPRVLCKYYMEGLCNKGDSCTFLHAGQPKKATQEAQVCRFFRLGNCLRGAACPFSHDLSAFPCRFYHLTRECEAGAACRFSHQPIGVEARNRLMAEWNAERERS